MNEKRQTTVRDLPRRVARFIEHDLWRVNLGPVGTFWRVLVLELRVGFLVFRGMTEHQLALRAAALTYISVFSLVPTLAVGFAMFMAFGDLDRAMNVLLPRILDYLAVGTRDVVEQQLGQFIQNIHGGAIGGVGGLTLGISVVSLLTNMERAFNGIWGVKQHRSLAQRVPIYWTMATVTPALLLAGVALSASVRQQAILQWVLERTGTVVLFSSLLPLVFVCVGFGLLYAIMPNTRVSPRAALIGGLAGGILWSAAVYGYAAYAARAVQYSNIYGSLGVIPIFLLWIYVTWLIVLLGAEVAFAHEHVASYGEQLRARDASLEARRLLALRIMCEVTRCFMRKMPAPSVRSVADALDAPPSMVAEIVAELIEIGMLFRGDTSGGLSPGRDPHEITPADVVLALERRGERGRVPANDRTAQVLATRYAKVADAARAVWSDASIASLSHSPDEDDARSAGGEP